MSEKESNWKFAEDIVSETEAIARAREHSVELGVEAISPAIGAQIAVIAAASRATSIIEIGTGLGVSGLYLLAGAPNATLTTIDVEVDHQQFARDAYISAGTAPARIRLIPGRANQVLPRMNEASYDVVLVDADPEHVIEYVEHGLRLARLGGTVLVPHALWRGRVADPVKRDRATTDFRLLLTEVSTSGAVRSALSPAGDGLLQLTKVTN
ncbi:O-methyltransferase [Curtobacterium flaccumfaciens]|uniref:O-methyltransferase n=1 Tax=Curtobacterium flaccumfaciens TaxID=2035 RepID=UPI001BDEB704|nr:class I SAM-dependent methyltransferase [Curtobacterium flaccumfaciens]MBT1607196.1 class I SAM-dependent methyltransferase [Curtobacterium flaccumfaciens pv. betae]MBT1657067.1 class I SAM-dependent methyltransferase [Curtobacterium flaccumfaciens pv. betae]MCS0471275.1 class I SAM-dependent methyltransferase [Curtobacterium flaccumfaciens pv. betae]MCS0474098.1 class I SAM-dependent methyltransferase [Curtobacterium flaccumfaciens pv. betae]MCS0477595.1 class I SAM-dependent methyltransfe